jgi:hypothetical protein
MDESQIKVNAAQLWKEIEKTLHFYNSISCQCAFPRFQQYVSIDCADTGNSFYISETEAFISLSKKYFDVKQLDPPRGGEVSLEVHTCKKCRSVYEFGWSDFSIYVSRSYLKLKEKKIVQIGAEAIFPIPVFVGPFGHSYPEEMFQKKEFEDFTNYLYAIKNG